MGLKGFLQKNKRVTSMKVTAAIFLIAVFYIGSATFPSTLVSVLEFLKGNQPDIATAAKQIDDGYRGMLGFDDYNMRNKGFYINLNGLMARIMGQRYMNERVKLDNGHLTYLDEKRDITLAAAQLTKLYEKQNEKGKAFLFVITPSQIPKYENVLPIGYADYTNQNADNLSKALKENNIPVLDLRDELIADGVDYDNVFFITDHHWKPETGFWAYTKILDNLAHSGIIKPVASLYTDIGEYNIEVYNDFLLGSGGKRTGIYYAGVDDFAIITPKFETDISIDIPSKDIFRQGDFSEIAFARNRIKKDYFSVDPYTAYGHGRQDYIKYRNETAPEQLKVLTIGDSFSNCPFTFLSLIFQKCDQLDMMNYQGDFNNYYFEFDPDIVIVLVNPYHAVSENTIYDFFNDFVAQ